MRISIFGLGYVGCVTGACLADEGHTVIGIDKSYFKIKRIEQGKSPLKEKGLDEIIERVVKEGRFLVMTDPIEAINNTDLSIICVGTPSNSDGSLALSAVRGVVQEIGLGLRQKRSFHVIVLRSTVLPGSTEQEVIPLLEQASGRKAGVNFGVGFNPEFIREGNAIYDFYHPARTIISATDDSSCAMLKTLCEWVDAPLVVTSFRVAEMVKYVDNAFHALKISFSNEIGNICQNLEVDSYEVMKIFCMDQKLNLSPAYLNPGFAFGGSCLPKDLRALLCKAKQHSCNISLLESILKSNEVQLRRGIDLILKTGKKKIGLFGLAFKAGTDDLRDSPMLNVAETLLSKGREIYLFDNNISLADIHGTNREYIEKKIGHLEDYLCSSIEEVVGKAEVLVIGNTDKDFLRILDLMNEEQILVDLVGLIKDTTKREVKYLRLSG